MAEKGCLTLNISVETEGGHSSRPFRHTGIGILSKILVEMEANPQPPKIVEGSPLLTYLECAAEYGDMEEALSAKVRSSECWPALADEFGEDRVLATFLKTTQAIDIISGGIKYNALPEVSSSADELRAKGTLVSSVADKLSYRFFRDNTTDDRQDYWYHNTVGETFQHDI